MWLGRRVFDAYHRQAIPSTSERHTMIREGKETYPNKAAQVKHERTESRTVERKEANGHQTTRSGSKHVRTAGNDMKEIREQYPPAKTVKSGY
jgi:hypothetical protein